MKKNSNKKTAFTLIEVLLALFTLATAATILANLQGRAIFRVIKSRDEIEKIFFIKKDLYALTYNVKKDQKKIVNKLENPEMTITSELVDIQPKSTLKNFRDKIKIAQTDALWIQQGGERQVKMLTFVFIPPEDKEEKK
jgi:Tfp pilus assembly protein PilV